MGELFLIIIVVLAVLSAIGTVLEVRFWETQQESLSQLDLRMRSNPNPPNIEATFEAIALDEKHPLRPALDRILATESSPEVALDLVDMSHPHERILRGIRQYATSVLLLFGIAGTLFSLKDVMPSSGIAKAFTDGGGNEETYKNAFRNLEPALANAFWPSICGIIFTLGLQLARYGYLAPAQDRTARQFVAIACKWLIPWKVRRLEEAKTPDLTAERFEAAANILFAASKAGADALREGAEAANASLMDLGTTMNSLCAHLAKEFEAGAAQILTASLRIISGVESSAQKACESLTNLGVAIAPAAKRMDMAVQTLERSGNTLSASALQFEKSWAANGPFLKAIEQLYAAVSPAEARHERLLVSVGKLHEFCTQQNVEIARLFSEVAALTKSALQSAEESKRLTQSVTLIATGFPDVSASVKAHEEALTKVAEEWRDAAKTLASEFVVFRRAIGEIESSHGKTVTTLLAELPGSVAESFAEQLPPVLEPLTEKVADSQQGMDLLQGSLTSLETSIDALRGELRSPVIRPGAVRNRRDEAGVHIAPKRKWWFPWAE